MTSITDAELAHRRFAAQWTAFIDGWTKKIVYSRGGSAADADDLRQAAHEAAWNECLEWQALPEHERDLDTLGARVGRRIKDAILEEWDRLRQRARNDHQRGGGSKAGLLRDYLTALTSRSNGSHVRGRLETTGRYLVAYHLLTEGLLHDKTGLVSAETTMLRDEARFRLEYALEKLGPDERRLIQGVYFENRTLTVIGAELGVGSASSLTRMHHRALDVLRNEMEEYASILAARNAGHTLNDEPGDGGSIA